MHAVDCGRGGSAPCVRPGSPDWPASPSAKPPRTEARAWTGQIDPRLHDLLEDAVELVLMCLWHPWRSPPRYRRRLRQLERRPQTVALQLRDDPNVHWSLIYRRWQDPARAAQDDALATPRHPSAP